MLRILYILNGEELSCDTFQDIINLENYNDIKEINCNYNQLTFLPVLPKTLTLLSCNGNQLTSLPTLPESLTELWCENNQLTSLPVLPETLTQLWCEFNKLTFLPVLPESLTTLYLENNNIESLSSPLVPKIENSKLNIFKEMILKTKGENSIVNEHFKLFIKENYKDFIEEYNVISKENKETIEHKIINCEENMTKYKSDLIKINNIVEETEKILKGESENIISLFKIELNKLKINIRKFESLKSCLEKLIKENEIENEIVKSIFN